MTFQPFFKILLRRQAERRVRQQRDLLRWQAQMGGELFGPVPAGRRREFIRLDDATWIWHEEWVDLQGVRRSVTTRYDIRPEGILKAQDGQPYRYIHAEEAHNFRTAVELYNGRVQDKLHARNVEP